MSHALVYLVPVAIDEESARVIPAYVLDEIKKCSVFFVENERSARRFLKKIWKEIVIDAYAWHPIDEINDQTRKEFMQSIHRKETIGILSEAGCPGIADPGQQLVAWAHEAGARVKPLVGPNAMLLALMASGMNGQQFRFSGYLPIDQHERIRAIKELEAESEKKNCSELFMETPYRNNQLLELLMKTCKPKTQLCVAANITGEKEFIQTRRIEAWKNELPDLHKQPAVFILYAGN